MPRWEPDAVGRLQAAAIELFAEQGFERTTIAEITERAGLTKRSFFNHFADKREVLFGPTSELQRTIVAREIAACPASLPPLEAVVRGLEVADTTVFEGLQESARLRRQIIEANAGLLERELGKRAVLTDVIAAALRARGLDPEAALLTARTGTVLHQTAMERWTRAGDAGSLGALLSEALHALRGIVDVRPT